MFNRCWNAATSAFVQHLNIVACGLVVFCQWSVASAQQVSDQQSMERQSVPREQVKQILLASIERTAEAEAARADVHLVSKPSPISPEVRDFCDRLATVIAREDFAEALKKASTGQSQGKLIETNRCLDVAIEGTGYFRVSDAQAGVIYHAREGTLNINSKGQLVVGTEHNGLPLDPPVVIPDNTVTISIAADGKVLGRMQGEVELRLLGHILLSTFSKSEKLSKVDGLRFYATENCGPECISTPGSNGAGVIRQGLLEDLKLDPLQELAQQMTTLIDLDSRRRK